MSKEAIKLALEALEKADALCPVGSNEEIYVREAIYVITEALAKQEHGEPVAYIHRNEYNEYRLEPHDNFDIKSIPSNVDVPLFKSPSQPKQEQGEPDKYVMDIECTKCGAKQSGVLTVNTTPQQRKPLSEAAIEGLAKFVAVDDFNYDFARAIEKAHGIKE